MTYSRIRAINSQDEPGASCATKIKKKVLRKKITMVGDVRRTEEPSEGAPSNQGWNNWSKKLSGIGL